MTVESHVQTPCQETPDAWFGETDADDNAAKAVCLSRCPVRLECYAGAVERREPHGVWGGVVFSGGQPIARRPRTGRPRKEAAPPD